MLAKRVLYHYKLDTGYHHSWYAKQSTISFYADFNGGTSYCISILYDKNLDGVSMLRMDAFRAYRKIARSIRRGRRKHRHHPM